MVENMVYLFWIFLVVLGFYIIAPFFRNRKIVADNGTKNQKLAALHYRRQLLKNSLDELDFDYRMGKIVQADRDQSLQALQVELDDIDKTINRSGNAYTDKMKEKLEKEIAARKKQINSGKNN